MSFPNYSRRSNMVRPSKQTNKATKIFMETIRQAQIHLFIKVHINLTALNWKEAGKSAVQKAQW